MLERSCLPNSNSIFDASFLQGKSHITFPCASNVVSISSCVILRCARMYEIPMCHHKYVNDLHIASCFIYAHQLRLSNNGTWHHCIGYTAMYLNHLDNIWWCPHWQLPHERLSLTASAEGGPVVRLWRLLVGQQELTCPQPRLRILEANMAPWYQTLVQWLMPRS